MEVGILAVSSWTPGTQIFNQAQSIFTHIFGNIFGYLYIKASEFQNSNAEEDLKIPLYLTVDPQLIF